ncbi:hypothetical protein H4Q26_002249 [Puccinia striiformis f. sp. tritici PST-130]|nr:hypothetical protein H4Q26_002249 [Puccinia striiformis f. sp. tritici PST-130]
MAEPAPPTSKPCTRAPKVAKCEKNTSICALIQSLNWSTKDFMLAFLKDSKHQDVAISRRYWVTDQGWDSTKDLLLTTKRLAQRHIKGCEHWEAFILSQLQEEFTKNRLARLRPDAPGAMSMQEDDEIAGRDLNQDHNDQLAPHVLSDKGSGDEDGEIQEEEEG